MWGIPHGGTQSTSRRKNNPRCAPATGLGETRRKYENTECGQLFETGRYHGYHLRYHFGGEPNPAHPPAREGCVNRKTHYGHGVHPEDLQMIARGNIIRYDEHEVEFPHI